MNDGRHDDLAGLDSQDASAGAGEERGDCGTIDVATILRGVAEHRAALDAGDPDAHRLQRSVDYVARLFAPRSAGQADLDPAVSGFTDSDPADETGSMVVDADDPEAAAASSGADVIAWVPAAGFKRRLDDSRVAGTLYRRVSSWSERRRQMEDEAAKRSSNFSNRLTAHIGRHPYLLTACATSLAAVAGGALTVGWGLLAAVAVTFAGLFELVDGAGAKQASDGRVGVFIDYIADRVSDLAILGAIIVTYGEADQLVHYAAVFALVVSFLSSYARAQADALDLNGVGSLFGRAERFIIIALGYWFALVAPVGAMRVSMVLASVISLVTFVERVVAGTRGGVPRSFRWEPEGFLPEIERELDPPVRIRKMSRPWAGRSLVVECQEDRPAPQHWRIVGVMDRVEEDDGRFRTPIQILRRPVPLDPTDSATASSSPSDVRAS